MAIAATLLVAWTRVGELSAASPANRMEPTWFEAQRVLARTNTLDIQHSGTVEAWDGARYILGKNDGNSWPYRALLRVARRPRHQAIAQADARLGGL